MNPVTAAHRASDLHLISLPVEVQLKIYGYVFVTWSLGIFEKVGNQNVDDSIMLREVNDMALSGPPGSNLLQTCRFLHRLVKNLYGQKFTRDIYICHRSACYLKILVNELPRLLRNWFKMATRLHLSCPPRFGSVPIDYLCRLSHIDTLNFTELHEDIRPVITEFDDKSLVLREFDKHAARRAQYFEQWFLRQEADRIWVSRSQKAKRLRLQQTLNVVVLACNAPGSSSDTILGFKSTCIRSVGEADVRMIFGRALRHDGSLRYSKDAIDCEEEEEFQLQPGEELPAEWKWVKTPGELEWDVMDGEKLT